METNLQRQVLTSAQIRVTPKNLNPSLDRESHRKKSGGSNNKKSESAYLDAIVNKWDGEPEELFKRKNWESWIKREADSSDSTNSHDKYLGLTQLQTLASALMSLVFEENNPHIDQLREKFNTIQRERFQRLKKEYDDKEYSRLYKLAQGLGESFEEGNSDDENVGSEPEVVEVFQRCVVTPTPKPIENSKESPRGGLFEEPYSPTGFNYSGDKKLKPPKRPVEDITTVDTISNRKKLRKATELDGYKKLEIKRIPRSKVAPESFYSKTKLIGSSVNSNTKHRKDARLDENGIRDILNESSNDGKEEIYENSTPPYSPSYVSTHNYSHKVNTTKSVSNLDSRKRSQNSEKRVSSTNSASTQDYQKRPNTLENYFPQPRRVCYTDKEKENSRQEKPKIFANNSKSHVRNEPFTASNQVLPEGEWEEFPDIIEEEKENFPVSVEEILERFPKPPSAPALTLEMFEEIKKPFDKPAKEKVVSGFGLNILQEDLIIISQEAEWLIDLNIDFYMELIRERSKQEAYPSIYIFRTFFYALLAGKDLGFSAVEDTTGEDDILQFDLLFIPVNLNQHWRLIVVKVQEKAIECYDSMKHNNSEILDYIEGFLLNWERLRIKRNEKKKDDAAENEKNKDDVVESNDVEESDTTSFAISASEIERTDAEKNDQQIAIVENFLSPWTKLNKHSTSIPQQNNAIDCGVFVLQYAEYISRQQSFDFNQSHIPYFRKRIMFETLTKTLLTSS